jgi:hypothetical protein
MDMNKAGYWIALGVLALGLNSEYQHGRFVALHRVSGRADSLLCRISTRAEQTLAMARGLLGDEIFPSDNLVAAADEADVARDQAELLREQVRDESELIRDNVRDQVRDQIRAQADATRAQVNMRRAEIDQVRFRTRSQVTLARTVNRRVTVVCPKKSAGIIVSAGPEPADDSVE